MDILKFLKTRKEAAIKAAKCLQNGKIVILPTETSYGFSCDIGNKNSLQVISDLKKRAKIKPFLVLVKDLEMMEKIAYLNDQARKIFDNFSSGPLSVILKKKDNVSSLVSDSDSIAVRISNHPFIVDLFNKIDSPIISTSANIAGEDSIYSASEIVNQWQNNNKIDLFVDSGDLSKVSPSTIVDLQGLKPKIVRQGPIKEKEILNILNNA